jgi:hypothetical protein
MKPHRREATSRPRKPYSKPRLEVYGDLGTLTNAVGNMSTTLDGGTMSTQKTM